MRRPRVLLPRKYKQRTDHARTRPDFLLVVERNGMNGGVVGPAGHLPRDAPAVGDESADDACIGIQGGQMVEPHQPRARERTRQYSPHAAFVPTPNRPLKFFHLFQNKDESHRHSDQTPAPAPASSSASARSKQARA